MRTLNELPRLSVSAHLVDARGRACPAPIIELAKALRAHALVELWADDPAARADLDAFCAATNHRLERSDVSGWQLRALVRRKSDM